MKPPSNPLSEQLRLLRKQAGMSGAEAARKSGLSPAKISRVETGAFMPTPEQVDALCRIYRAPAAVRRKLVELIRELRADSQSARVTLQRGGWQMQQRIGRIEAAAEVIRSFSSDTVIGIAQSESYIRAMMDSFLEGEDLERTLRSRLAHQELLRSDRLFRLVMTEGALRWNVAGPSGMAEHIAHLGALSSQGNIRLGIIPWTVETRLPGVHAFHIYDTRAAIVGTMTATAVMTDGQSVSDYLSWFERLEALACFDDEARAELERIANDYRRVAEKGTAEGDGDGQWEADPKGWLD